MSFQNVKRMALVCFATSGTKKPLAWMRAAWGRCVEVFLLLLAGLLGALLLGRLDDGLEGGRRLEGKRGRGRDGDYIVGLLISKLIIH